MGLTIFPKLISINEQLRPEIARRAIHRHIGKDKRQRNVVSCRQREIEGGRVEGNASFSNAGHGTACFPAVRWRCRLMPALTLGVHATFIEGTAVVSLVCGPDGGLSIKLTLGQGRRSSHHLRQKSVLNKSW